MKYEESQGEANGRDRTTKEFAWLIDIKPQSILKRYSQTGSYFGVCPIKLPNRLLRWPADAIEKFLTGQEISNATKCQETQKEIFDTETNLRTETYQQPKGSNHDQ